MSLLLALPAGAPPGNYTLSVDPGIFVFTGSSSLVLVQKKLVSEVVSYLITGATVRIYATRKLNSNTASYSASGSSASLVFNYKLSTL